MDNAQDQRKKSVLQQTPSELNLPAHIVLKHVSFVEVRYYTKHYTDWNNMRISCKMDMIFKAYMNSDIPLETLETAATFFLANLYLTQGFWYVYVMVDSISLGLHKLSGERTKNYKMKISCPQWDWFETVTFHLQSEVAKHWAIRWDIYWNKKV